MKNTSRIHAGITLRLALLSLFIHAGFAAPARAGGDDWPALRGSDQGRSSATGLPLTFDESTGVKWKTRIPGEGWSSPVILGSQVWMATALDDGRSLRAVCVDRDSGTIVHNVEIFAVENPAPKHDLNSYASPTPVIEKGRVYFAFGMYGCACIDTETGGILWTNQNLIHDHDSNGPGSAPILYKDFLILNCDGTQLRYVAALNKNTGEIAWQTDRSNEMADDTGHRRKAYATPLVITVDGNDQLVSPGAERVSSYDPNTGREIWFADCNGFSNVPTPVYGKGKVYITTGFGKAQLYAIRPTGKGNVTKSHVDWINKRSISLKPSPLMIGDHLFLAADNGVASCIDADSGKTIWNERIGGEYSASPLFADGRIYFFSMDGQITVVEPSAAFNTLATSKLGDGFMATPAIGGKAIFLRSKSHLYRVEL